MAKEKLNKGGRLAAKMTEEHVNRPGNVVTVELDSGDVLELPGRYKANFGYGKDDHGQTYSTIRLLPLFPVYDSINEQTDSFVGNLRNQLNRIVRSMK